MAFRTSSAKNYNSSSSGDDADSDDQREVHWKRVRKNTDLPDLVPVCDDKKVIARNNNISSSDETNNQRRKVNTIWADVHSEQDLTQKMSSRIGVSAMKQNTVQRGPESYDRSIAANRNFATKAEVLQNLDTDLDTFVLSMAPAASGDDLFDNVYLEAPEPLAPPKTDVEKRVYRPNFRKRRHDDDVRFKSNRHRVNHNDHLNNVQTQPMKIGVAFDKSEPIEKLGAQMSSALNETKSDLITKCIKVLGVDKCLELYAATENVEKNGGMLTLDNRRRRTPGGVFLQLLRDDASITEQSKKELFLQDREIVNRNKRLIRKIKRRKNFDELLLETKAKIGQKELPDKKDLFVKESLGKMVETGEEDGEILSSDEVSMQ